VSGFELRMRVQGSGFRVQGLRLRVYGSGSRVVSGSGFEGGQPARRTGLRALPMSEEGTTFKVIRNSTRKSRPDLALTVFYVPHSLVGRQSPDGFEVQGFVGSGATGVPGS